MRTLISGIHEVPRPRLAG